MIDSQLPSPGLLGNGIGLRREMAKAISYIQVMGDLIAGGKVSQARELDLFLQAARTAIAGFIEAVIPTFVSGLLDRSENNRLLTLTFSEGLDPTSTPARTAFAVSGNTVTGVEISGTRVLLTLGTAVTADGATTVTYTKPASGRVLRDPSLNEVATFGPSAVTNQA